MLRILLLFAAISTAACGSKPSSSPQNNPALLRGTYTSEEGSHNVVERFKFDLKNQVESFGWKIAFDEFDERLALNGEFSEKRIHYVTINAGSEFTISEHRSLSSQTNKKILITMSQRFKNFYEDPLRFIEFEPLPKSGCTEKPMICTEVKIIVK